MIVGPAGVGVGAAVGKGVAVGVCVGAVVEAGVGSGVTPGCAVTVGLGTASADGVGLGVSEHPGQQYGKEYRIRSYQTEYNGLWHYPSPPGARLKCQQLHVRLALHMTRRKVRLYLIEGVLLYLSDGVRLNLTDAAERRTLPLVEAWICRPRHAMRLQSPAGRSIGPTRTTCGTA